MSDLATVTRIEAFLSAVIDGTTPPAHPRARAEYYLAKIAGADVEIPDPVSRMDYYLAKLAGADVEIPTPVDRADFWLAKLCGQEVETPTPVYPLEFFLEAWKEAAAVKIVERTVSGQFDIKLPNVVPNTQIKSLVINGCSFIYKIDEETTVMGQPYVTYGSNGYYFDPISGDFVEDETTEKTEINGSGDPLQTVYPYALLSTTGGENGDVYDTQDLITGEIIRRVGVKVFDGSETWVDTDNGAMYLLPNAKQDYTGAVTLAIGGTVSNMPLPYLTLGQDFNATDIKQMSVYLASIGKPMYVFYPLETPTTENVTPQPLNIGNSIKIDSSDYYTKGSITYDAYDI